MASKFLFPSFTPTCFLVLALSSGFSVLNAQNFYVDFRPGLASRVSYHNFTALSSDGFFDLILNERSIVPAFGLEIGFPQYRSKFRANFYSLFASTKVSLTNGSTELSNFESFQNYFHFTYFFSFRKFDLGLGISGYSSPVPNYKVIDFEREGGEALSLSVGFPIQNFDFVFRYDWLIWPDPAGGFYNVFIDEPTFFSLELAYPIRLTRGKDNNHVRKTFKNPFFINFGLGGGFNPTRDLCDGQRNTRSYIDVGFEYLISQLHLSMYFQRATSLSFNEISPRLFQNHSQQNIFGMIYWSRLNGKEFLKFGIGHSWEFHKINDWKNYSVDLGPVENDLGSLEKLKSAQFYGHKAVVFSLAYPLSQKFDVYARYHLYYSSENDLLKPLDYRNVLLGLTFKLN